VTTYRELNVTTRYVPAGQLLADVTDIVSVTALPTMALLREMLA
jgi:hypothetical protein